MWAMIVKEFRQVRRDRRTQDRKSTRLNSSHSQISYAVFCLKKKKQQPHPILQLPIKTEPLLNDTAHAREKHIHSATNLRAIISPDQTPNLTPLPTLIKQPH